MKYFNSIGEMIKWLIKCRNKKINETAMDMDIKYTTFCEQLNKNTLSAETLFRLAVYLDLDLNWMMTALGYYGYVSPFDRELIPRMGEELRKIESKQVYQRLDELIRENPTSTAETRRLLLNEYSKNMFYLLDVLVPEEYNLYMVPERDKMKFYVDIPRQERMRTTYMMRRKAISALYDGAKALDIIIEERKEVL